MKKFLIIALLLVYSAIYAADVTVEVISEALIVNNDIASAKIQAESRARWAAMEKASQVKVTVGTVVNNAELLDESIKSVISGSIAAFKILDEGKDGDTYWMKASVTVKPEKATDAMGAVARNSTILVYFPLVGSDKSVNETHPFSEALVNELIDKGFDVVDLSMESDPAMSDKIAAAVKKGDTATVRSLATKYLAGSVLVGRLVSVDKGKNTGYGTITFSIVSGEGDYRLIGDKDGKKTVLTSGTFSGTGQGATAPQADIAMSKNLAKRNSVQVASAVATKVMGENKRSVQIVVAGDISLSKLRELRDNVKNISWVLNVREQGTNGLVLDYPEKTLYLATIIARNTDYTVKNFTDTEIVLIPR